MNIGELKSLFYAIWRIEWISIECFSKNRFSKGKISQLSPSFSLFYQLLDTVQDTCNIENPFKLIMMKKYPSFFSFNHDIISFITHDKLFPKALFKRNSISHSLNPHKSQNFSFNADSSKMLKPQS